MDAKYYLPADLAAKVAYYGFNEDCTKIWNQRGRAFLRNPSPFFMSTFSKHSVNEQRKHVMKLATTHGAPHFHAIVHCGHYVAAPTWEQIKEWLRINYHVDFIERPHVSSTKQYICDPVGPGINVRLEPKDTPLEALEAAMTYVINTIKPLPCNSKDEA